MGIEWKGRPDVKYNIGMKDLVKTGVHKRAILYQWLIEITHDVHLTSEDIYSLNTAFFYCLDMFRTDLDIPNYVLIAETLKSQQEAMMMRRMKAVNGYT